MSDYQELHYEPLGRRKKKSGARPQDQGQDSQGQQLEYERGYLRERAKAARGVTKRFRGGVRRAKFVPAIVPDSGIQIIYVLEFFDTPAWVQQHLRVELWWRNTGESANQRLQPLAVERNTTTVPTAADQRLVQILFPHQLLQPGSRGNVFLLPVEAQNTFLGALAEAEQVRWSARKPGQPYCLNLLRVSNNDNTPWMVEFKRHAPLDYKSQESLFTVEVTLGAPSGDVPIEKWQAFGSAGWVMAGGCIHRIRVKDAVAVLGEGCGKHPRLLTTAEASVIYRKINLDGNAILMGNPPELSGGFSKEAPAVQGHLYIETARFKHLGREQLQCTLSYNYGGTLCGEDSVEERLVLPNGQVVERDRPAEEELRQRLVDLGFRLVSSWNRDEDPGWKLLPTQLDQVVRTLVSEGWHVIAQGKSYRMPVDQHLAVSGSGLDWLNVKGGVDFGDQVVELPELLQMVRKGQKCVRLDDGTYGIIPQEWLEKYTALVEIGEPSTEGCRVRQQQAMLLQSLLNEQLQDADGRYGQLLQQLDSTLSTAAQPMNPPETFLGKLRPYQSVALGWMHHLGNAGIGCLLADDMGLGKTVEVLALLATRQLEKPLYPSLVVMPASLLFNWEEEARKFAPQLRCARYYGSGRIRGVEAFQGADVYFTTYGTLRLDVENFAKVRFDYVILDESQAIKNSESLTARVCCALKADRRIAMTGTPVENSVAELFSQLAFLNPGLFPLNFVQHCCQDKSIANFDSESAQRLRRRVAPFILRRRKEQVATELPAKVESVLWCDLPESQRYHYDELLKYYRHQAVEEKGNFGVLLAALMRLRQAACHAGLINPEFRDVESAKLTILKDMLSQLVAAGHKALVFSQFTTLLKLAAEDCSNAGLKYCYLDGQTNNRGELVAQFQNDPETGVFFISLKAGGTGLNLTAADYVFILDPWWNPAAEAQAVDRAYRIGQQRQVLAYRMIARDTVEEKVRLMQEKKQAVAISVLGKDGSAEDAEALPPGLTAAELHSILAD